jgi:hypothetical protein
MNRLLELIQEYLASPCYIVEGAEMRTDGAGIEILISLIPKVKDIGAEP